MGPFHQQRACRFQKNVLKRSPFVGGMVPNVSRSLIKMEGMKEISSTEPILKGLLPTGLKKYLEKIGVEKHGIILKEIHKQWIEKVIRRWINRTKIHFKTKITERIYLSGGISPSDEGDPLGMLVILGGDP